MTKFFLTLLLALPLFANAKDINNVWLPFAGGNLESVCRSVWADYDNYFHTSTVIFVKQGAAGELASVDMIGSSLPNKSMCSAATQVLYSKNVMPNMQTYSDELELIVKVANNPMVWYGPSRTPNHKNFNEFIAYLKSLKRPINVGVFAGPMRTIAQYVGETYNVEINVIMYKNTPQMYPSLADGSLDIAIDSGGSLNIAEEGKFKVLGYTATHKITRLKQYQNFALTNKDLNAVTSWFGITVNKSASPEYKEELARRLEFIIKQDKFHDFADMVVTTPDGTIGKKLSTQLEQERKIVNKYLK